MYLLRLLGPPSLEDLHGPVSGRVAQERKLAVLAVLARADNRTVTRDFLAAMFWPDSDQSRARHNVADAVWVTRSALGERAVLSQGNRLTLNPEVVETDVEALEAALGEGDLVRAADLYTGRFMEGFHSSGAPEFEQWVHHMRRGPRLLPRDSVGFPGGRGRSTVCWGATGPNDGASRPGR
jgi:DNA-binding SARP family transcriptional activator